MRYFVKGELIDPGAMLPRQQFIPMFENVILPSLDAIAKLESSRKILAAGLVTGSRGVVLILDTESHEKLTKLLMELPFWGLLKWDVTPLDIFENRLPTMENEFLKSLKKSVK